MKLMRRVPQVRAAHLGPYDGGALTMKVMRPLIRLMVCPGERRQDGE